MEYANKILSLRVGLWAWSWRLLDQISKFRDGVRSSTRGGFITDLEAARGPSVKSAGGNFPPDGQQGLAVIISHYIVPLTEGL